MSLGEKLLDLRKNAGFTQEDIADKLCVSPQTVSKWENNQTVPELIKAKLLSQLYNISSDYLISGTGLVGDVTSGEMIVDEIDWTSAWSKKYPILASYQGMKGINSYCEKISKLYDDCKNEFNFSDLDTGLVLKDILYQKYKIEKRNWYSDLGFIHTSTRKYKHLPFTVGFMKIEDCFETVTKR
jgi:transcriptional regulator with XRE-family HTH domain